MAASKGLTLKREERAWDLSIRGFSTRQIARILEKEGLGTVGHVAVSRMHLRVAERLRPAMLAAAEEHKTRQLAALCHVYNEAIRAWHKSKQGERQITGKKHQPPSPTAGPPPDLTPEAAAAGRLPSDYTVTVVRDHQGASEYLRQAMQALADIRRLLGLNAPTPIRATVAPDVSPTDGGGGGVMIWLPHNGRDDQPDAAAPPTAPD